MRKSCLVTGGSRSGKSGYALELGKDAAKPFFIATGWAGDAEMADRIKRHQAERPAHWTTIETRLDVAAAIREAEAKGADFILLDCLTLWTSNMLFDAPERLEADTDALAALMAEVSVPLVFVTNEVGSGIVPGDPLSRAFRDAAGRVNRKIATAADSVFLTVCGIPMKVK
jgi:adenosylcobinamide kinase / adenosylcobinamide-phosphate guanylyltransferase